MPLPENEIESELSYAYLHAVASKAGLNCRPDNRQADNDGTDALVDYKGPIPNTYITDVPLRIQLKATKNMGAETATHISYPFQGIPQYNKMRTNAGGSTRILIILFLPNDPLEWLACSPDQLVLKNAAYWVCLYGAPIATTDTSKTIYVPKTNLLTPDNLNDLCVEIGKGNTPSYVAP